ncbi:MAG: hypothetical protein H6711_23215 [Myxococcales bacterium]|nr:hypothetical protein [Myxococcales bacterium]
MPPGPASPRRTIVRCPKCGSTDAGAAEYCFEFTRMRCDACAFDELLDDYEIGDRWNVRVALPADAPLPRFLEPLDEPARAAPGSADTTPPKTSAGAATPSTPRAATPPAAGPRRFSAAPSGELVGVRCPRCRSSQVGEDSMWLVCLRCGHDEEINSDAAAERWRARGEG